MQSDHSTYMILLQNYAGSKQQ